MIQSIIRTADDGRIGGIIRKTTDIEEPVEPETMVQ